MIELIIDNLLNLIIFIDTVLENTLPADELHNPNKDKE